MFPPVEQRILTVIPINLTCINFFVAMGRHIARNIPDGMANDN